MDKDTKTSYCDLDYSDIVKTFSPTDVVDRYSFLIQFAKEFIKCPIDLKPMKCFYPPACLKVALKNFSAIKIPVDTCCQPLFRHAE